MDFSWFTQIEEKVFTRIQYNLKQKDGAKYPELNCTTKGENISAETGLPNVFPTLYLVTMQSGERGSDLEGSGINAVLSYIQIEVYTNTSESDCKKIMTDVVLEMKSIRYKAVALPVTTTRNGVSRSIARFRRVVGSDDVL